MKLQKKILLVVLTMMMVISTTVIASASSSGGGSSRFNRTIIDPHDKGCSGNHGFTRTWYMTTYDRLGNPEFYYYREYCKNTNCGYYATLEAGSPISNTSLAVLLNISEVDEDVLADVLEHLEVETVEEMLDIISNK